jgi:hypothetical protein
MTFRESDGRIVPLKSGSQSDGMKPSNIGAGKAARVSRDPDRTSSVLRDGVQLQSSRRLPDFSPGWHQEIQSRLIVKLGGQSADLQSIVIPIGF